MSSEWASPAFSEYLASSDAAQNSLPIRLIETPRSNLAVCGKDEKIVDVAERNKGGFDHFPVLENHKHQDSPIVGLLDIAKFESCKNDYVSAVMYSICDDNLIGGDASIKEFLKTADLFPSRFVISGKGISGIVTLSDIQKLPVRIALFSMITSFELLMINVVKVRYGNSRSALHVLPTKRQTKVCDEFKQAKYENAFVDDLLLYTQFCDKVTMLKQHQSFFDCRKKFEKDMKKVQKLRDNIAHANNYAATKENARETCEIVGLITRWEDLLLRP